MKRRRLVAAVVAGALLFGGAGVAVDSAPSVRHPTLGREKSSPGRSMTAAEMASTIKTLSSRLTCSSSYEVHADTSFFDPAEGVTCLHGDGNVSFLMVYEHASTVGRVLQEWEPTFGSGRVWSRGSHWVFLGTPSDAKAFGGRAGGSAPTATAPPPVGTPAFDAARDTCMSFLFATAYDGMTSAPNFAATARELDGQYPGAKAALEGSITDRFREQHATESQDALSAALTRFAPTYRDVCRAAR